MNFFNKFLKRKFREKGFSTPKEEAESLMLLALRSAYNIFRDRKFRKIINFEKQDEEEQNRLFNELAVTAVVLLKMILEDDIPRIPLKRREFWQEVDSQLIKHFHSWLGDIGIPDRYLKIWKKLFQLRINEFKENEGEARHVWLEELLASQNEALNDATVRVGAISVSAWMHLRRQKPPENDKLRDYAKNWIISLNNQLAKRIGW